MRIALVVEKFLPGHHGETGGVEGAAWDGETALCNNAVQPVDCICGF